jgi:hypothetical protein
MLSGGIHHRSKEYKNGGDKEKTEKNGDIFWGKHGKEGAAAP